jgi:uncharacterized protein (DUF849 family)
MSKIIVTVAPTGGMASKAQNPNLPTQPDEITESVYKSYKEGTCCASISMPRRACRLSSAPPDHGIA